MIEMQHFFHISKFPRKHSLGFLRRRLRASIRLFLFQLKS